ncbi:DUF3325 domain-containing protein [Thalassolituus oleivorans]|uniref:DUF3325 domain-containing protein n=1 Tax=Thalassolituus oleivorans TaxID=187493 RepID=UPI001CE2947B|nr:DUF3325 domain-containing protein [Thalassolituus oleivorans]MCA6129232.1 hypothetical protein [Thalassolituus oleivorans 4BN06-13]
MNNSNLWLFPAIVLMLVAMSWLALSLPSHWKQVRSGKPASRRLRLAGWNAIFLSALCCFKADHASMAVLVWLMLMAATAASVGITLSMRPHMLKWLSLGSFAEESKR